LEEAKDLPQGGRRGHNLQTSNRWTTIAKTQKGLVPKEATSERYTSKENVRNQLGQH
jgi:hypothetical protein